jgi:hypothetical protein
MGAVERVEPGAVVVLRAGIGRLAVQAPCRVVSVLDRHEDGTSGTS